MLATHAGVARGPAGVRFHDAHPVRIFYLYSTKYGPVRMTLQEMLGINTGLRTALFIGSLAAFITVFLVMPIAMRKLRGARIVGVDRQKPGNPEIPEMGGLVVFLGFNAGVFVLLILTGLPAEDQALVLASLIVAAGATLTGALDDLISLQQRSKAFIPVAFALPLALYVPSTTVELPHFGVVEFGLLYTLLFVPAGITCASNGFNMFEGFNGLGAGLGLILAVGIGSVAYMAGNLTGFLLLVPLVGALLAFLYYNVYPAKIFPGDTMTLLVGAVLAAAAILSKVEFWGFLMFVPHVVEFFLKAASRFKVQSFSQRVENGKLRYDGPIRSIPHIFMRYLRVSEPQLVAAIWIMEAMVVGMIVASAAWYYS